MVARSKSRTHSIIHPYEIKIKRERQHRKDKPKSGLCQVKAVEKSPKKPFQAFKSFLCLTGVGLPLRLQRNWTALVDAICRQAKETIHCRINNTRLSNRPYEGNSAIPYSIHNGQGKTMIAGVEGFLSSPIVPRPPPSPLSVIFPFSLTPYPSVQNKS